MLFPNAHTDTQDKELEQEDRNNEIY